MGSALYVGWSDGRLRESRELAHGPLPRAARARALDACDVIYIGIDNTDAPDSPGTNQLARHLAAALPPGFAFRMALRHQLLFDPRIPCTSENGSASFFAAAERGRRATEVIPALQREMRAQYVSGSDPGLCVAEHVHREVMGFGKLCKTMPLDQEEARTLASAHGIHLEGFGGTEDGVIGALAAVGLAAGGDDGRVIHLAGWTWPDPVSGWQSLDSVLGRGVNEVCEAGTRATVEVGLIDVGKQLRPSHRAGRVVLFVERAEPGDGARDDLPRWRALELD